MNKSKLKQIGIFYGVLGIFCGLLFISSILYIKTAKNSININTNINNINATQLNILMRLKSYNTNMTDRELYDVAKVIYDETHDNIFTPTFILAIIKTESRFNKNALSSAGAYGLMQLLPNTAKFVARDMYGIIIIDNTKLYNPALNVKLGITYLKLLKKRFHNMNLVLAAYNMGPTALRKTMHKYGSTYIYKYTRLVQYNKKEIML